MTAELPFLIHPKVGHNCRIAAFFLLTAKAAPSKTWAVFYFFSAFSFSQEIVRHVHREEHVVQLIQQHAGEVLGCPFYIEMDVNETLIQFYYRPPERDMFVARACCERTLNFMSTGRTYTEPNAVF
ncbi:hypothetical protein DPMN_070207 [Dreissena polymorpha]|uniref:Uncharacterized protein n=1 Tax=Dreissena polymorpha TaxID=45954 RepID=A0A9D3Z5R6_DREPO|nr:hypothetical protein DPMN_070207 [Dreissena polymorpha]